MAGASERLAGRSAMDDADIEFIGTSTPLGEYTDGGIHLRGH